MASNTAVMEAVQGVEDVVVDRAMAAALGTASGDELMVLCNEILKRRRGEGILGMILYYHRLPDVMKGRILGMVNRLFTPLRQAASRRNTEGPANVLDIVREAKATRLSYLVGEQLRHGTDVLRDAAAYTFVELAKDCVGARHGIGGTIEPESAAYLQKVVDESVVLYDSHMHPGVLVAMCGLISKGMSEASHVLSVRGHAAVGPIQSLLRQGDDVEVRRATFAMMGISTLSNAALDGIKQAIAIGRFKDYLDHWEMLEMGRVRDKLELLRSCEGLWPGWVAMEGMNEHQRRGMVTWLDLIPMRWLEKVEQLKQLTRWDDTGLRLMGLRILLRIAQEESKHGPCEAVHDAIAEFSMDRDEQVARIALWHLIGCKYSGLAKILASVVNSEHESVRHLAGRHLGPLGFKRLWDHWSKMDHKKRMAAGRALIKISPRFHVYLDEMLRKSDVQTKLRSISMIDLLGQGDFFERKLIQLTYHMDNQVRASAVKALGTVESHEAAKIIETSLSHTDDRVRANAIEAVAAIQTPEVIARLMGLTHDDANRSRANAIGVLMQNRPEDALVELRRMLIDNRASHRVSALWLVEVLGLVEVAKDVVEMSVSDPEQIVQERADRVVRELMRMMNDSGELGLTEDEAGASEAFVTEESAS
ncbi:HEAT repeat protein [Poriferisphaera corsica]|uniref:HEAT repeat protein n=2 Tax=Poriferisphaera corsica TaxID=2528020 RepID=A0A517YQL2_9BACT|nr:HEAT repeat protein [Poriferisphaera corsica]